MKSPFKFLDPYSPKDKDIFFGRDQEIEELYQMVFKTPLMLVYGTSGTGKTSLVQCGLASKFDGPEWHPFFIRRQNDINDSIAQTFNPLLENEHTTLKESVQNIYDNYFRPVYLIFDQFEEIFILGSNEEQEIFIKQLKELLDAHIPCKVIIIMREEYIGQLYSFEREIPSLLDFRFRVEKMTTTKIKEVITSTFSSFNVSIDEPQDALLDQMIVNILDEKSGIALPYLQVYMDVLYRTASKDLNSSDFADGQFPDLKISKEIIDEVGEIEDVLDQFLDQQMNVINQSVKENHPEYKMASLAVLLDAFVTEDGTKRPIPYIREAGQIAFSSSETEKLPSMPQGVLDKVIDGLESSRLLRVSDDSIELAHDSLAALIDSRRSDEQRSLNSIKKRLTNEYNEYLLSKEPLSRNQLLAFEEYIPILNLDREVLDFIHFSEKEIARKEQEEIDRKRKELELEEEKKRAQLVTAKARAERDKLEAEKATVVARKRLRWALIFLFAAVAGVAALGMMSANQRAADAEKLRKKEKERADLADSLTVQAEKLANFEAGRRVAVEGERDSIRVLKDSIQTIFDRLRPHVDEADKLIRGDVTSSAQSRSASLLTTAIFIRGIMNGEPDSRIERFARNAFVYPGKMYTTTDASGNRKKSSFQMSQTPYLHTDIRSPKKERIQLKWFHSSDTTNAVQIDEGSVDFNIGSGYSWYKALKRANRSKPGMYIAKLYNELDYPIGRVEFTVEE